jgi:hypothetical protein
MKTATRTSSIRTSVHAHALLRRLAKEEDDSMQAVPDKAIERYRRDRFLRDANAHFAALRRDKKAWKEELQAVADGLAKE